jgi:hypothetical protein
MERFSMKTQQFSFAYPVSLGQDISIPLPPYGQYINSVFIRMPNTFTGNVIQSFGTFVYDTIELKSGDNVIERLYGETEFINNELSIPLQRRPGLSKIVGNLEEYSAPLSEYYIPIPITIKPPTSIPLSIHMILQDPSHIMTVPYIQTLNIYILVEYIYTLYVPTAYKYLTRHYQRLLFTINPHETTLKIITSFTNYIKELFWVIGAVPYNDDIIDLSLMLGDVEYLSRTVANNTYLSVIQPYQYHTRVSNTSIYSYSFALFPEKKILSGEMISATQIHQINVVPRNYKRTLTIYADTYNICTINGSNISMMYETNASGFKNT